MSFLDEFGLAHVWQNIKTYIDDAVVVNGVGTPDVPPGGIIIWSGSSDNIPYGWALCDGENGTPDLRGRFVMGESETHVIGSVGGEEEVALTADQMPVHSHEYIEGSATSKVSASSSGTVTVANISNKIGRRTSAEGGNLPHPNMPPYYVLCYIMKL